MRPVAVVVVDVDAKDALELAAVDDQDPVEALASDGADEALGVGVRPRRLDRRLDDSDPFAAEDLVERAVELGEGEREDRLASRVTVRAGWSALCVTSSRLAGHVLDV